MVIYKTYIKSDFQLVDLAVKEALERLKRRIINLSEYTVFKVNFTLREMLNNAVEHGNAFDYNKEVYLKVEYQIPHLIFTIRDEGAGIVLQDMTCPVDEISDHRHVEAYHAIKANETLELVKQLNASESEPMLKTRNRGYETVRLMAFKVNIMGNTVVASLDLSKEEQ